VFTIQSTLDVNGSTPLVLDVVEKDGTSFLALKPLGKPIPDSQKFRIKDQFIENLGAPEGSGFLTRVESGKVPLFVVLGPQLEEPDDERQIWTFEHIGPFTSILLGEADFTLGEPSFIVTATTFHKEIADHVLVVTELRTRPRAPQIWVFNQLSLDG
jgi:hypothetical protein